MSKLRRIAALPLLAVLVACESNPTLVDDGNLTAELTLSAGHVHTLSELGLEVTIRNGDGFVVDDFEAVTVDRRTAGSDTWRSIALTQSGEKFSGAYTFTSSGDYDLRVMVTRHGSSDPVEVPLMDHDMGMMSVARAHVEVEGVRIEFETFPGHIHEGDEVEMKFWVLEPERNAQGVRPPIEGLAATILCYEGGTLVQDHDAHAHEDGVYEASHLFSEAGDGAAGISFHHHGKTIETSFEFHVVHGH